MDKALEDIMSEEDIITVTQKEYRSEDRIYAILKKWNSAGLIIPRLGNKFYKGFRVVRIFADYLDSMVDVSPSDNFFTYSFTTKENAQRYIEILKKNHKEITLNEYDHQRPYKILKLDAELYD